MTFVSGSSQSLYLDGSLVAEDTTEGAPNASSEPLRLGKNQFSDYAAMRFYGAVLRHSASPATDRAELDAWLMDKAGL